MAIGKSTVLNAVRSVLTPDGVYRFVPGGKSGTAGLRRKARSWWETGAYHASTARLESSGVLEKYLRLSDEPGPVTGAWGSFVVAWHRTVDKGPSLTGLTDSLYEDLMLACCLGGVVSCWRLRRSIGVLLGCILMLHLMGTAFFVALPRYVSPLKPLMSLYAALAACEVGLVVRWIVRAAFVRRAVEEGVTAS